MGLALAQSAAGEVAAATAVLASALVDAEEAHGPRDPHVVVLLECARGIGLVRRVS
jgi:hypothetical protein